MILTTSNDTRILQFLDRYTIKTDIVSYHLLPETIALKLYDITYEYIAIQNKITFLFATFFGYRIFLYIFVITVISVFIV